MGHQWLASPQRQGSSRGRPSLLRALKLLIRHHDRVSVFTFQDRHWYRRRCDLRSHCGSGRRGRSLHRRRVPSGRGDTDLHAADQARPPDPRSEITIPAGTLKGTVCTATLPCKPDAFIKVMPVSGDTGRIEVVVTLSGPR